ncbi:MAG: hypothetical protein ACYDBS_10880, partial [Acidimicrobiales bacterium]
MSLRLRLAALFGVATALLVGIGGFIFVHELNVRLRDSLAAELQARATTLLGTMGGTTGSQYGVRFSDTRPAPHPKGPLADAALYEVLKISGAVADSTGVLGRTPLLTPAQVRTARTGSVLVESALAVGPKAPLLVLGEPIQGSLDVLAVATSLSTVEDAVGQVTFDLTLGGSLAVLLAALAAWILATAA